ncbi:hypothetical protein M378DRAFT_69647 [Amanita muscaria Koide BX008]|uniref:ATP-dependent DNA ligase family profile domain-containing protein n=1 Tax=Amanita muscaria (strain Koide BX008) TaxID=946122 RepID=A0A0C2T157_AMAMK|nr:hypothetical protein M378DRAFT_69647 [Amanita muscaria Koide BX008]
MLANLLSFTSLLTELSLAPHGGTKHKTACLNDSEWGYPALRIFVRWVKELRRHFTPYPNGTMHNILRLLFPEEDVRRKYGMQEKLLGSALTQLIGIKDEKLQCWNSAQGSGCLGQEVQKILAVRSSEVQGNKMLSITDIDDLLDELASTCEYSHASLRLRYPSPRSRPIILRHLYSALTPADASFVTQIILKDLRPLIYPLPTRHATSALRNYNASSHKPLRIEDAMRVWDPSNCLLKSYRLTSTIGDLNEFYEEGVDAGQGRPRIGAFIEIPKSRKGRGCLDALSYLRRSNRVWAETKYDGERAQIHVEILSDVEENVTIFSKSKRDSTQDRKVIHDTIRHAIGLHSTGTRKVKQNVILDAEMVACQGNRIDEFWKIRRLLEKGTMGLVSFFPQYIQYPTHNSRTSAAPNEALGHLGLVFFDVMVLDSRSLIHLPYCERRKILESLIQTSTGQIYLAERTPIDLDSERSEQKLQAVFAQSITNFEEGIVLKAEESFYNDHNLPWVKLKKDYIPDYGDAIDLVLLGAAWDKERARELRVPPTVFTTFFLGALTNAKEMEADTSTKPHFYLSIAVSYGMTREQVEELNFSIRNLDPLGYDQFKKSPDSVDYAITLCPAISDSPAIILKQPLLAELFGAGFSKPSGGEFYELRFPRITKVYDKGERSWRDGIGFQQLQDIAYRCTGQDRTFKDVDDWCNNLWGKEMSPGVRSRAKRKASVAAWQDKFAMRDRRSDQSTLRQTLTPSKKRRFSPFTRPGGALEEFSAKLHDLVAGSNPKGFPPSLLETALVWFSKGENEYKLAWKQHVSPGNCVHSLESLLVGCGWGTTARQCRHEMQRMEGVERGLIIVHDVKWKRFVLEAIDKAIEKCKIDNKNDSQDRKPILVIDVSEGVNIVYKLDVDTIIT